MRGARTGAIPFLKWAGGKRWLVDRIEPLFSLGYRDYYEPFLGGGAMLLALGPKGGVVSDINHELVNCYQAVRDRPEALFAGLLEQQELHSHEHYYRMRDAEPKDSLNRAIRFLYLNRACFNGIYRVNQLGKFNVPKGSKEKIVFETDEFELISQILRSVEVVCADFEETVCRAGDGDLVFVDPPYTTKHNKNGFVRYNEKLFTWADQERLADAAGRAAARGAKVIVTNADHESVRALYDDLSAVYLPVGRWSVIGGPSETRGKVTEAIFLLGDFGEGIEREVLLRTSASEASLSLSL